MIYSMFFFLQDGSDENILRFRMRFRLARYKQIQIQMSFVSWMVNLVDGTYRKVGLAISCAPVFIIINNNK